jgi:hypothetical protein
MMILQQFSIHMSFSLGEMKLLMLASSEMMKTVSGLCKKAKKKKKKKDAAEGKTAVPIRARSHSSSLTY